MSACQAEFSPDCTGVGTQTHHRKLRRHGDESPANLLRVCVFCHARIHAEPGLAYGLGLLVRSWDDSALVPVRGAALAAGGETP